ncbi:MAG: tRNA (N(6)-L-threonylcarbamoyladenosine(37)-C(2))-methylthiotransferase MtaB [Candidatus Omnitrophica bacterium]|nr:tRNA (N(6)-L-threonylcarbamoyladenosine(37)-C(2))-methylthiotransferase MtaB [Candidatus Omnitrophota bacterium]
MKRISFYTFGCRLNQSETASIQNSFEQGGYKVVDFAEPSDIVVINTCTVTEGGDADTRRLVNKVYRQNPLARIALVGCQAQIQREKLAALPGVRWIVGNGRKMDLLSVLNEAPEPDSARLVVPVIEREPFKSPVSSVDHGHTRANIKIQDGCDFFCSFCEIPYARGRARSRVFEDILIEAQALIAGGHKELILTGINVGTYSYQGKTILDVVHAMSSLPGLERLRISSIEPTTVSKEIFNYMKPGGKLCRYLHLPLQSGDDEILQGMKRKYTVAEFGRFIKQAVDQVPQIGIGTDVIVGFPGETDTHFERTVEALRELPIHYFHVFSYSPRAMAQSRLKKTMPPAVITRRSRILRELSSAKRRLFNESLLGTAQKVLFEQAKERGWQHGLTDNYVRVKIKGSRNLANQLLPVRLNCLDGPCVLGELI